MKEIKAYISRCCVNQVVDELEKAGAPGITITEFIPSDLVMSRIISKYGLRTPTSGTHTCESSSWKLFAQTMPLPVWCKRSETAAGAAPRTMAGFSSQTLRRESGFAIVRAVRRH